MKRWLDLALGVLVGVTLSGIALWLALPPGGVPIVLLPPPPTPTRTPLEVYVAGAVRQPGVYALPQGSRVDDAVAAAGGFAPDALVEAVNLAAFLEDGMRVYVPSAITPTPIVVIPTSAPLSSASESANLVNVNTATAEELETLPRIGPALAQRILEYRQSHGPFQKPEDLLAVKGIGPTLLATILPYITVEAPPSP